MFLEDFLLLVTDFGGAMTMGIRIRAKSNNSSKTRTYIISCSTSTVLVRLSGGGDGVAKTDVVTKTARTMAASIVNGGVMMNGDSN